MFAFVVGAVTVVVVVPSTGVEAVVADLMLVFVLSFPVTATGDVDCAAESRTIDALAGDPPLPVSVPVVAKFLVIV